MKGKGDGGGGGDYKYELLKARRQSLAELSCRFS
jgi:hypothetical protein